MHELGSKYIDIYIRKKADPPSNQAFFSGFLAVINLQRIRAAKPPGILFNIILHLLFFYLAAASVFGLSHRGSFGIDYPSCRSKDEHCLDFKWKWVLLSNTALAGGIIFA